jgi:hypothetical protein
MNFKHGFYKTGKESRIYQIWKDMLKRCSNRNNKDYKNYGDRGITVCERWLDKENGFKNFLEDMGEPSSKHHSIDRINNDLGYYKENCRWATSKEQARNTSRSRIIVFNEKTQCVSDLANDHNINKNVLGYRLNNGWSIEEALNTPIRKYSRK